MKSIPHMSKSNVILSIFLIIGIVYLVWAVYAAYFKNSKEHFTEVKLTDYEARMAVMKVFDTVLHRKPLPDEIDKYAKVTNEQDMLIAVMTDYNVTTPPPTVVAPTANANAIAPVPVVVDATTTAVPPSKEEFDGPAPAPGPGPSKQANANGAVPPSSKQVIDLTAIETNLSSIVNTVNSIRALLYTQTMCEE